MTPENFLSDAVTKKRRGNQIKETAAERALAAWGDQLPAWVQRLAEECDATSQAEVAGRLGYSPATLSYVLRNAYKGDLAAVELAATGVLMAKTVQCPVLGDLRADDCLHHQREPWSPNNPTRIALYKACRGGCPNFRAGARREGGR